MKEIFEKVDLKKNKTTTKRIKKIKISNNQKVPCDVVFTVKPVVAKGISKQQDIFEVEPSRAQVMNHSYVYATVTFTPPSMQVSYKVLFCGARLIISVKKYNRLIDNTKRCFI